MDTITKPIIAKELLESLKQDIQEEQQVIVHCCYPASYTWGNLIRVWRSTYLVDKETGHKSSLVHAENITVYPYWTEVDGFKDYWFTLVFTGLPKNCSSFDLQEIIPQEGGFHVKNIRRNSTDIYRIKIS